MTDTPTMTTSTETTVATQPATTLAPATTTASTATTLDLSGLFDLVPGIKTSELWVVVASAIGGVLAKLGVFCTAGAATCSAGAFTDQDFTVLVGAALFYAFGRWVLKNKTMTLSAALQQMLNSVQAK